MVCLLKSVEWIHNTWSIFTRRDMSDVKKAVVPVWRIMWLAALVLFVPGGCIYDLCYDETSGEPVACEAKWQVLISTVNFSLSVLPDVTCGDPASTYRRLGHESTLLACDSSTHLRHLPSYMTDSDASTSWWQSVTMAAEGSRQALHVNITLSFGKLYALEGDLVITFQSGKPEVMDIEKSADGGVTWSPLRYYARVCQDFAPDQTSSGVTGDNPAAVICDSTYAERTTSPEPGGQVIFPSLKDRLSGLLGAPNDTDAGLRHYYTKLDLPEVREFQTFSDLRFRLLEPATDGLQNYDMYYYAVSDIRVTARCFCNLHANTCTVNSAGRQQCSCEHNTAGQDCEACLPLYNDRPWQRGQYAPFDRGTANECRKCECNDHALRCVYDPEYGRGVCEDCLHNTSGRHCELCAEGFYVNHSLPPNNVHRCAACDCDSTGTVQGVPCTPEGGQCQCKPGVAGRRCDTCLPGYYKFSENGCAERVAALETYDTINSSKVMATDLSPVQDVGSEGLTSSKDKVQFDDIIITAANSTTNSLPDILVLAPSTQTNRTVVYNNLPVYVTAGVIGIVVLVLGALFLGVCWKRAKRRKARGGRRKNYSLSNETPGGALRRVKKLLHCASGNDVMLTRWVERRPNELSGEVNYGSDFCSPAFYIDSGESTDGDSLQRGCSQPQSAANYERGVEIPKGRLDPNSELQRKSKLPSFSALDRKRKERLRKADAFDENDEGISNPSFDATRAGLPSVAIVAPLTKPVPSVPVHSDSVSTISSLESSFQEPGLGKNQKPMDFTQERVGLSEFSQANSDPVSKKEALQPSHSAPVRPKTLIIPESLSTVEGAHKTSMPFAEEASRPVKILPASSASLTDVRTSVPETGSGRRAPKKPRRRKPPSNVSDTLKSGSDVTDVSRNSSAISLTLYDTGTSDSECGDLSESSAGHKERVPVSVSRPVRPRAQDVLPSHNSLPAELTFAGLDAFDEVHGSLV